MNRGFKIVARPKLTSTLLTLCISSTMLSAQVYHKIGFTFSGLRSYELDAPSSLLQDLDFFYAPGIAYNYHFSDNRFALGLAFGLVYESGSLEQMEGSVSMTRRDTRNSLLYEISAGTKLRERKASFIQLNLGLRVLQTYYFEHYSEERYESGVLKSGGYKLQNWYDPVYSVFVSIGYNRALKNDLNSRSSLIARFAMDIGYQFPSYYGTTAEGVSNEYSTIRIGPSLAVLWRIKGVRGRGLF